MASLTLSSILYILDRLDSIILFIIDSIIIELIQQKCQMKLGLFSLGE